MEHENLVWPPPYKLIRHRKARHVKLRATKNVGLQVTVPYRFNIKHLPAILEEHREWIFTHLTRLRIGVPKTLPDELHLRAIDAVWRVSYMPTSGRLTLMERPQHELVVMGHWQDHEECFAKLNRWVKAKTKKYLHDLFLSVQSETQLKAEKIQIREQKSRWGSCSAKKSITLNYRLIFLTRELVRHVMIHELCHTVHMNHSPNFWNLVAQFDLNWRDNRRALKEAEQYIPNWL